MDKKVRLCKEKIAHYKRKLDDPDNEKYDRDMSLVQAALKNARAELKTLEA